MNRLTRLLLLAAAGAAISTPAAAFQFENGTIWPLAVGINGGTTQIVPPEDVAFLHRGQCNAGCSVNILVADPSRPQTIIAGAGGQPTTIVGNGDEVIVRVRQERGGLTVEVAGNPGAATLAPTSGIVQLPQQPQLQPIPASQGTVPATVPALTAPPPATNNTAPGFVPPPPAPDYEN